jgi:hypothetical protein
MREVVGGNGFVQLHKSTSGGDIKHSLADASGAESLLGFIQVASLREDLASTLGWTRSTPV